MMDDLELASLAHAVGKSLLRQKACMCTAESCTGGWIAKVCTDIPGGNALKFYSSVRMDIRRIGAVKKGEEIIGNQTRVKVVKNKMAPPFRQTEFEILYGEGISRLGEVIDLGVARDLIKKSGA